MIALLHGRLVIHADLWSHVWFTCFFFFPSEGLISPDGLLCFLMGPETTVVMQDRLAKCQDMTQPIPHYFIKSSHNTYLTGHLQLCYYSFANANAVPNSYEVPLILLSICRLTNDMTWFLDTCLETLSLSVALQPVSSPVCPPRRCTDSVCCLAAAVWSWTAGRANLRMKSQSSPTASPWRLRSSSRHVNENITRIWTDLNKLLALAFALIYCRKQSR